MRISVIVPALDEAAILPATLYNVLAQSPHEIIVVDGGSTDETVAIAKAAGVRLLKSERGRAVQMNAGAAIATGEALLFLHADCRLEDGAIREIARILSSRSVVAGCFRMAIQDRGLLYRSIAWCATARVKLFGIIYGDQGLFVRRDRFMQSGGFPKLRLMEDVWLSLRLRRIGPIRVALKRIFVSTRRWQKKGIIRQTLRNWALTAAAAVGVHPDRLARFYPNVR